MENLTAHHKIIFTGMKEKGLWGSLYNKGCSRKAWNVEINRGSVSVFAMESDKKGG